MKQTTYHHKNLRNELIEKGIELVEEYGMQQLSLRKVAQACNCLLYTSCSGSSYRRREPD